MEKLSISRFWRKRDDHYTLKGKRCRKCGRVFYPPKHRCPYCGSKDLEDYIPPREGELLHWTKLYNVGRGYTWQKPLYLGIVKLGELLVYTQITDVDDEQKLHEGAKVETVFRKVTEDGNYGLIYYGLKVRLKD
jgi:uncharacterized OB-fold protein